MSNDLVLYHVYGRLEEETFSKHGIYRDELPPIIQTYMAKENVTYHMILGINGDGVICSPVKDWNPQHPEAFSNLDVIPWADVKKIKHDFQNEGIKK
jgi:hypothetical protein